jgi:hypothetical protein
VSSAKPMWDENRSAILQRGPRQSSSQTQHASPHL